MKDNSKQVRLELTDEELSKYADQAFLDHIKKKEETKTAVPTRKDPLFEATQARKVDWTKPSNTKETGVSIKVGQGPQGEEEAPVAINDDSEGEGDVVIEELFDF